MKVKEIIDLLFKRKGKKEREERDKQLLEMYEKGQYLRVDENIDNKKLMLEKEKNGNRS